MLRSCGVCGKVHDKKIKCQGVKRNYKKEWTLANSFRNTKAWRIKRNEIVNRDKALCQLCIRKLCLLFHTKILNQSIQVHHITPVNEDYSLRLDNYNLICLCTQHHYMADHDQIEKRILLDLARVQEEKSN